MRKPLVTTAVQVCNAVAIMQQVGAELWHVTQKARRDEGEWHSRRYMTESQTHEANVDLQRITHYSFPTLVIIFNAAGKPTTPSKVAGIPRGRYGFR